jgi:hypothetical protein
MARHKIKSAESGAAQLVWLFKETVVRGALARVVPNHLRRVEFRPVKTSTKCRCWANRLQVFRLALHRPVFCVENFPFPGIGKPDLRKIREVVPGRVVETPA